MSKLKVGEDVFHGEIGETVLETLLRADIAIPHACKKGSCLSCMVRSMDAEPPAAAQIGLKDTQKQQGYFLACQCRPQHDMQIALADQASAYINATVAEKKLLSRDIMLLTLECKDALAYYAGQFVNLKREDGVLRSYSIASPTDTYNNRLNFHIRRLQQGRFSEWIYNDVEVGDTLEVSEAQGSCFYTQGETAQNLLLIGTGTGLAPLYGIASDALNQDHAGEIHLYHGSSGPEGLYYVEEMRRMAEEYGNFYYTPCVSGTEVPSGYAPGRAHDVALTQFTDLKGWKVFLCGHPQMVQVTKMRAFMNGAASQHIYADAFHLASAPQ